MRIAPADAARIPDLEPLTRALHAHHVTVDPAIPGIPPRDADASWAIRRHRYTAWLGHEDDTLLLIAEDGGAAVATLCPSFDIRLRDSHTTGARFAELQSLVGRPRTGAATGSAPTARTRSTAGSRRRGHRDGDRGACDERARDAALRARGFRPWVVLTMGTVPDPDAVIVPERVPETTTRSPQRHRDAIQHEQQEVVRPQIPQQEPDHEEAAHRRGEEPGKELRA